jgi:integrase/recombinase XerD
MKHNIDTRLDLYRRHRADCNQGERCTTCPIWVYGYVEGKRIRESLATTNMEIAVDRKRRKEKKQVDSFGAALAGDSITIENAIKEFLANRKARGLAVTAQRSYKIALTHFMDDMNARGVILLANVRAAMTGAQIDDMASRYSVRSRNLHYRILRVFLNFCEEREYVVKVPLSRSSRPALPVGGAYRPLTHEEQQKLLAVCDTPTKRSFFLLGLSTGLRLSDIASLTWNQINFQERSISIVPKKTAKHRPVELVIPELPKMLFDALREMPRTTNTKGKIFAHSQSSLARFARDMSADSGVEFTPHDMRCTFGVERLTNGAGMWEVSQLLGHSSVVTTERYYIKWIPRLNDRLARVMKAADFSHLERKVS